MKNVIILLVIVAAAVGIYFYLHTEPEPVAVDPSTPAPETPPPRHLAPEGVFYLTTWVKAENKDGITGLPPGTEVKLVKPGIYRTPGGEMPLDENKITNDLDIARRARDVGSVERVIANERQAIEEAKAAAIETTAADNPASPSGGQPKETKKDRVTKLLADLKTRKTELESKRKVRSPAQAQEAIGAANGQGEPPPIDQQNAVTEGTLKLLHEEIADVEKLLKELK